MEHKNILVVEDEKNISDLIKAYLEKEGYNVFLAFDGQNALDIFSQEDIHLIILDLMIPKVSGEEVCMQIRSSSNVPIIMLTAKVEEESRIKGLSIGADDYVIKPFSPRELVGRVKAIMRRSYQDQPLAEFLKLNQGDLKIDLNQMTVEKKGRILDLTTNEFKVLSALIQNNNQVLSREQLISLAFGYDYSASDRTVDTYIKNIRQAIEDDPSHPTYITTIYGAGYKFTGSRS